MYDASLAVDYILTPNGQMTRNPSTGNYTAQYNLTDHLGNVRSVVNGSGTVLQSTDYYPFGLAFSDSSISSNRYLYNGKKLEDYTVGSSYLGTLDYGARHYDPRIGRWTVPDPMAEKYYALGTYYYCAGNPILLIDSKGTTFRRKKVGGTIYISADYYVTTPTEKRSAEIATGIWNDREDKYIDSEGKVFRVIYSLTISVNKRDKPLNNYIIVSKKTSDHAGLTLSKKDILIREDYSEINPKTQQISSTGAHEIGHTLGMIHEKRGIMSLTQDEDRMNEVSNNNLYNMMTSDVGIDVKLNFIEKIQDFIYNLFH